MFRLFSRKTAKQCSQATSPSNPNTTACTGMPFMPQDWAIIETSPGGVDKDFVNQKTGEQTWYTPSGATAEEILRIPGASKYWASVKDVEKYIKKMAKQKEENGGKDIGDAE